MLRKIRIGMSVVLFALITFYFLDFADILPNSFHRLAHIQFVPAVLSLSIGILIVLIALTLLFGRIYCSTICPMGILQDVIIGCFRSLQKRPERAEAAAEYDGRFRQKAQKARGCEAWEACDRARGDGGRWKADGVYLRDGLFQRRSSVLELRDGEGMDSEAGGGQKRSEIMLTRVAAEDGKGMKQTHPLFSDIRYNRI